MKRINYIILNTFLFIESLLWTLIDLTRAARMRHAQRMKGYISDRPPDGEVEITSKSQE